MIPSVVLHLFYHIYVKNRYTLLNKAQILELKAVIDVASDQIYYVFRYSTHSGELCTIRIGKWDSVLAVHCLLFLYLIYETGRIEFKI